MPDNCRPNESMSSDHIPGNKCQLAFVTTRTVLLERYNICHYIYCFNWWQV